MKRANGRLSKSGIGRRAEWARRNVKLDKIREIRRGFVVQLFKGKKTFVPNAGFVRKPV